jgi:prevent-host-death family protein
LEKTMKTVSVSRLKASLSEYLVHASGGEEVLVTDRGRPVARIVAARGSAGRDAHVDDLLRRGLARGSTAKLPKDFWTRQRAKDPGGAGRRMLEHEREEGR